MTVGTEPVPEAVSEERVVTHDDVWPYFFQAQLFSDDNKVRDFLWMVAKGRHAYHGESLHD